MSYAMRLTDLQGKLKFTHSGAVRTKKFEKWQPPKPAPPVAPAVQQPQQSRPSLKLKLTNKAAAQVRSSTASTATPPPATAAATPTPPPPLSQPSQQGRVVLKFGRSNTSKG